MEHLKLKFCLEFESRLRSRGSSQHVFSTSTIGYIYRIQRYLFHCSLFFTHNTYPRILSLVLPIPHPSSTITHFPYISTITLLQTHTWILTTHPPLPTASPSSTPQPPQPHTSQPHTLYHRLPSYNKTTGTRLQKHRTPSKSTRLRLHPGRNLARLCARG
jgi:hypothetical protein